ncbi:DEAD/DEAH box helicase domain protein [Oleispira antarctica RB-8]|uniref:DEAD-box ATP-dependent RNA helicase RhpA n=1 Tax=Oleispira antarctica RB-8 TaxID=698738 RepID=R4YKU3_OLEAN|nr:DEAD/DEAH box helicase domain protein [Oleispira antarctica RB-8]
MSFSKLGLSTPIVKAVADLGYTKPTPIQKESIPAVLSGKNILGTSQTGTGKTASFVLPMLEKLSKNKTQRGKRIRALILTPTRELAVQIEESVAQYSKYLDLSSMALYGGVDVEPQKERLIEGVEILVATPGRLLDLVHQRAVYFDEVEMLVLDEADRMLDMGFIDDITKIIERLPFDRQNLLFSATINEDVRKLADSFSGDGFSGVGFENKEFYDDLEDIVISPSSTTAETISQWLVAIDKDTKSALLSHLILEEKWDQALIFIEKKHGAAKLVSQLEKRGIKADCIHGDRSQAMREKTLAAFKSGELKYLVATGIAARGIDIGSLTRVVNYDLPFKPEEYIHRVGRTGRAGAAGEAISFVAAGDFKNLCAIESRLGHLIGRKEIEGFVVRKEVPVSILNYIPKHLRAGHVGHDNSNPYYGKGTTTKKTEGAGKAAKGRKADAKKEESRQAGKSKKTNAWDRK